MTYPVADYVGVAGQTDFDVPFPYLSPAHVTVLVNGGYAPILSWLNSSRVQLANPVSQGDSVRIVRDTPIDQAIVQFHNSSVLTEEDLNMAVEQMLYRLQETSALYDGSLKLARQRLAERNGIATSADDIIAELANLVLEDEVLAEFRQRIADIDQTAAALAAQAITVTDQGEALIEQATSQGLLDGRLSQLRQDHEALSGVVDGLIDLENGDGIAAIVQQEADARVQGDTALAAKIALIGAKSGTSNAFILDLDNVKVSPTESLAQRLTSINAATTGALAAITAEQNARADAISAEAAARTTLGATLRGETDTKIGAAVQTEQTARVAGDAAEATARTALAATLRGETDTKITAAIQTEQLARASADSAEVTARTQLAATLRNETDSKVATVTAAVTAEQQARIDAVSAEATARTNLAATLRYETAASITTEANARVNADGAFTSLFTLLGAKNAQGTAFILDDNKVQFSNGVALGQRMSGIDVQIGQAAASVVAETNARVAADGVLAQSISVVSANYNGLSASVSTLSQAIDGVKARYGVSLDVNGYVTGFVQNNDGRTGSFYIVADRFGVVDPGSNGATIPFEIVNGVTYIKNAVIGDQRIGTGNVQLGAITTWVSSTGGGGSVYGDGSLDFNEWPGVTLPTTGGVVRLEMQFNASRTGPTTNFRLDIYRNGVRVGRTYIFQPSGTGFQPPLAFSVVDIPPAGTTSYALVFGSMGGSATARCLIENADVFAQEFKR